MNFDTTFCISRGCQNACHRKMTEEEKEYVKQNNIEVWQGYFCNDDGTIIWEEEDE